MAFQAIIGKYLILVEITVFSSSLRLIGRAFRDISAMPIGHDGAFTP